MKREFGKWLLDIAKYMVTALLLATIFKDMYDPIIIYMVVLLSLVILISGLYVIYDSDLDEKKKKKGIRK
jgi:hypothetical protein